MTLLNSPQRCTPPTNYNDFRIARPQNPIVGFTGEQTTPPLGGDMTYEIPGGTMQYENGGNMEYQ